jgi:hypothetical protein
VLKKTTGGSISVWTPHSYLPTTLEKIIQHSKAYYNKTTDKKSTIKIYNGGFVFNTERSKATANLN